MKRIFLVVLLSVVFSIQESFSQSPEELMSTIKQWEYKYNTLEAKFKKLQYAYHNAIRESEGKASEMDQYGDSLVNVVDKLTKELNDYQQKEIAESAKLKSKKSTSLDIKDPAFYQYLLRFHDVDNDGEITLWDAENTYVIDLSYFSKSVEKITSISGIEHFHNLKKLICSGNKIGALNTSDIPGLEVLEASNCGLTTLNLSRNDELKELNVSGNDLNALDISHCLKLQILICSFNLIDKLDLREHVELVRVDCSFNKISSLSFVNNRKIDEINCSNNLLSLLNVNNGADLYYLDCQNNAELTQVKTGKKQRIQIFKGDEGIMMSKE